MARIRQKLDRAEWATLSQDMQALYVDRNGTFFLDTDEADDLRTAFDRTKGSLAEAMRKLDAMKDVDPAEYERLRTAAAQAERNKEIEAGNFQKLEKQRIDEHAKELAKRDEQALKLRGQLEEQLVDGEITRAVMAKYPGAKLTPILLGAKQTVRPMEIGGRIRAVVLDDKGEPRLRPNARTTDDYMGPADRIDEMRNDKEWAGNFPATNITQHPVRPLASTPQSRAFHDVAEGLAQQIIDGKTRVQ